MDRKFGHILRAVRIEQNLSQVQLATLCSVSQPTIAAWERGAHAPRRAAIIKLASALGLTPSHFLSDEPAAARPIDGPALMQVPVLDWPERYGALSMSPVRRYLPIGLNAARPIAMPLSDMQMSGLAPLGSLAIIDIAQGQVEDGDIALVAEPAGRPALRRMASGGAILETAPLRGQLMRAPIGAHIIRGRAVMMVTTL